MTVLSVVSDATSVVTEYGLYVAIAVAIPLGIKLMGWIKRAVARG